MPLCKEDRDKSLALAQAHCSEEFALGLELGFFAGLRTGSIISLTDDTLSKARKSGTFARHWEIPVGPQYGVDTKLNVNYWAVVPDFTMQRLAAYAWGDRRSARKRLASGGYKKLIFINRFGDPLSNTSWQQEITKLRDAASLERLDLRHFYFHCSRATFGTILLDHMLSNPSVSTQSALKILKRVMGHSHESTSLTYVRWVEEHEATATMLDDYGKSLLGDS